jgi:hypothetical protein
LSIDPPAVLRGLRDSSAPIYGNTNQRWSVPLLVKTLGPAVSRRLSFAAERGMSGTAPIRRLWMHSIGTACAARALAEERGSLAPDEAYLLGLLRSLPQWIDHLSRLQTGQGTTLTHAFERTRSWNLPAELAAASGVGVESDCAADVLALLADAERAEFLGDLGLEEPGLNRVIRAAYQLLGLKTFFTAGPKEVRAWTVAKAATAPQAAGAIHTDFERGFIRAEVIGYDDYVTLGGEHGAREAGRLRLEGKTYVVVEGDVCHFRFNV